MKRLILIAGMLAPLSLLGACSKKNKDTIQALPSDEMAKSFCLNCKHKPFYVDGHWLEKR